MASFDERKASEIIVDLLVEITGEAEIGAYPDLDLFDEGFLDSLSAIELMIRLNGVFEMGMEVSDFDIDDLGSINQIVDFCMRLVREHGDLSR